MDAEGIRELFADILPVRVRRMFGGHGIYDGETMFALEAGGEIWLKADAQSVQRFEAAGSAAFTYQKQGKPFAMSYWRLPDEALDDADALRDWTRLAVEAARRPAKPAAKPIRPRASTRNPAPPR
ncbi:MAG: TfoX/Sxy family protein [Beijerinckiaceae bacterium]|nr:TfoX/Sxy family protein [Beijerinckiaceae bacterium]